MHIAIVGSGLAALALSWHLLNESCHVTLFGKEEGASAIATGLLHPYPGERGRRSWKADEALSATKELLEVAQAEIASPVANFQGILRYALDPLQASHFLSCADLYGDMERVDEKGFIITSGMTVFTPLYLEGLRRACQRKGAVFYPLHIQKTDQLKDFDISVIAAGAGSLDFQEIQHLKIKLVKGQVLTCRYPDHLPDLERSMGGKAFLAKTPDPHIWQIGSTFERYFSSPLPDMDYAKGELFPRIAKFFPAVYELETIDCRAAFRVTRPGDYKPLIEKIGPKLWVFTGLGSRGLLYHSYFGKMLSEKLCSEAFV